MGPMDTDGREYFSDCFSNEGRTSVYEIIQGRNLLVDDDNK